MPSRKTSLVWFRRNLRTEDNLVLKAAMEEHAAVVPVFVWDECEPLGGAGRWWLSQSVDCFKRELEARGSRLILRRGNVLKVIERLLTETDAKAVFAGRACDPEMRKQEILLAKALARKNISFHLIQDALLFDPLKVRTLQGTPFKVFTPFWKCCGALEEPARPLPVTLKIKAPAVWPKTETLKSLGLEPRGLWTKKLGGRWKPGRVGAAQKLQTFLKERLEEYGPHRDLPAVEGTSRLSPYLHFGEISIRKVWHEVKRYAAVTRRPGYLRQAEAFLRQLVWREFAHHMLYHFPGTTAQPLREEFKNFSWNNNLALLRAWQRGETGYPIVDAGMRELWATGWMHNRVRMIVGSFLVKDLGIHWVEGARWFWDTLVDADLANNTFGWQWVAGCGADAAPFFRIFNPVLQSKKFDPQGKYIRSWVPELSRLPAQWIHQPSLAPAEVLTDAGVALGKNYPRPVVDHDQARKRALVAFFRLKKAFGK